jgi:DNA-binding transcriptional regulator YhcF (GntR family)
LRKLLQQIRPGERVTTRQVAEQTGLAADSVDTVLRALTRASIYRAAGPAVFVRERFTLLSTRAPR